MTAWLYFQLRFNGSSWTATQKQSVRYYEKNQQFSKRRSSSISAIRVLGHVRDPSGRNLKSIIFQKFKKITSVSS